MNVILYNTTDDERAMLKTLANDVTLDCAVYENCNILTPRILLEYNTSIFGKNYCYIPSFNRYYFIRNMNVDAGERIILNCEIDVLQTYKSYILPLNVTVVRNEYALKNNLVDPLATFTPARNVDLYPFSSTPFNIRDATGGSVNYILVVGGGYGS